MPRNSQGLYTLPLPPVRAGELVESVWANTTLDDLASAMTGSLPRNGSAPMTGPLTLSADPIAQQRQAATKEYVDQFMAFSSGMFVGALAYAPITVEPVGWLLCDGRAVSRTTYATLFAAIGVTFGSGDGSTTFNLPNQAARYLRGTGPGELLGQLLDDSLKSHTHPVNDPGHTHEASQAAHGHSVPVPHTHGINDPGHAHSLATGGVVGGYETNSGSGNGLWGATSTGAALTGISVQSASPTGTADSQQPAVTVASATTGETIGASGDLETRPKSIVANMFIKAKNDSTGTPAVTGITSSDSQMIAIVTTNPVSPELSIQSNVAFGIPKLDASGKIQLNQMPFTGAQNLGFFDASSGNNPSEAFPTTDFNSGDWYSISVGGSVNCYDPVTLVSALRVVAVGSTLQYIENSLTNPTGWYTVAAITTVVASQVGFSPVGTVSATNVQDAIAEVSGDVTATQAMIPTTASQIANVPAGGISGNTVQLALNELDTEKATIALTVAKDSNTGAAQLPVGTQIQRPAAPAPGMLRFNDDTNGFEGFNGTNWGAVGGGATGAAGNPFVYENDIHVTANYSITTGKNAMSAGPITVDNGVTVTVPSGSVWSII